MTPELFLQTVVNATYAASYMALIAVGLAAAGITLQRPAAVQAQGGRSAVTFPANVPPRNDFVIDNLVPIKISFFLQGDIAGVSAKPYALATWMIIFMIVSMAGYLLLRRRSARWTR